MAWYDFLMSTPAKTEQLQRFTPQQQSVLNQLLSQGQQGLQPQNFGAGFDPIAQQARTQFQQQTIPSLAERFTSMGGGQRSSAFQGAIGSASSNLEQGLGALKANFGLQQNSQLQNLLGMGLTPQFENLYHERQPGFLENLAGPALQALILGLSGGTSGLGMAAGAGLSSLGSMGNKSPGGIVGNRSNYGSGFGNPALWNLSNQMPSQNPLRF